MDIHEPTWDSLPGAALEMVWSACSHAHPHSWIGLKTAPELHCFRWVCKAWLLAASMCFAMQCPTYTMLPAAAACLHSSYICSTACPVCVYVCSRFIYLSNAFIHDLQGSAQHRCMLPYGLLTLFGLRHRPSQHCKGYSFLCKVCPLAAGPCMDSAFS